MLRLLKLGSAVNIHPKITVHQSRLKCTLCNHQPILAPRNRFKRLLRFHSSTPCFQKNPFVHDRGSNGNPTILDTWGGKRSREVITINREEMSSDSLKEFLLDPNDCSTDCVLNSEAKEMLEELEEMQEEGQRGQEMLLEAMPINTELVQKSLIEDQENSRVQDLSLKTLSKKNREELAKMKSVDLEVAGKEKSFTHSLITYIDMCVNCGFMNRSWSTLSYYKEKKIAPTLDVRVLNILMEGYAKMGNVDKVMEIWEVMESQGIKPCESSFAHRIEAIARSSKHDKHHLLSTSLKDLTSMGLDLDDMFNKCIWKRDSREIVLGAIRVVRPNYTPCIDLPDMLYSNSLVNALNDCDTSKLKSPSEGLFSSCQASHLFEEQIKMEVNTFVNVKSIEKEPEASETITYFRSKLDSISASWDSIITSALKRELATLNAQHKYIHKSYRQLNIYPYLVYLDRHQYKEIIMHEIRKLAEGSETYSPTASQLCRDLGYQVWIRCEVKRKNAEGVLDKTKTLYNQYFNWYLNPALYNYPNSRYCWQTLKIENPKGPSIDYESDDWPPGVLISIGRFLYNIILKDIKIDVNVMKMNSEPHLLPAFYTIFRHQGHMTKEEVKPHPVLSKLFRAACLQNLKFNVTDVPMMSPPLPWSSLNSGGYIVPKTNLIRLPQTAMQQLERLKKVPESQIFPVLDALNQLGSIPWKVNKPVLDVIIEIFNNGGSPKLDIPEPPSACLIPESVPVSDKAQRFQEYRKRMVLRRKKAEMYSLWCDALYRLSLANHFRDKIFWLPHNMDFRGRVYPCPPHLNHLGSDMSRSLLIFAKGETLGPDGLNWLKIHLINLTGLKKRESNSDRLEYANSILPSILDSAENPLNGEKWWMESEEPCQTLACCMEIKNALANPTGPENYVSHFPVHQDGSCNGLQHYAALGRDAAGAFSVNLSPADVPQDVYSAVATIVERERISDANNGVKVAQILEGYVKRKVIKQTVMTTVYGVTRFGARLQIAKQLKDIDDFPKDFVWQASTYLVTKTFASLREMFTSAREIQDWFTESAKHISQICGQNVEYITPLGLPVVQPYTRYKPEVKKKSGSTVSECYSIDMFERPNVMKQKNAFPPNFIHSLDSTHMMLTSLHCERAGITYVSVHDCFWTHPKTLPLMNKICREQFVALHSQPILNNLSDLMLEKFGYSEKDIPNDSPVVASAKQRLNSLLKQLPRKGDFDLSNVINSEYFFS